MRTLIILSILLTCLACKPSQYVKTYPFLGEEGNIAYYNFDKEKLPIIVVIPAVYNSLITESEIEKLTKKNRVVVAKFISHDNTIRLIQVDGVQRRIDYYSDVLTNVMKDFGDIETVIAEGINSNVTSKILTSFTIQNAVMINAWKPTIKAQLIDHCYASPSHRCDSLLSYLDIGSVEGLSGLLLDVESGVDNLYGHYAMRFWKDALPFSNELPYSNNERQTRWIYTTSTGLIDPKKADAKENIDLYTIKEFKKLKSLLNK